ncbi:hypothetical protein [Streptomyces sp. NPDC020983]|uniref:hypothetical protein n=1 Tax=Streptomyces sp. NPDC020983 TaxID=3365106 RepID=UPI0037B2BBFF
MTDQPPASPCRRDDQHGPHDFEVWGRVFRCPGAEPSPAADTQRDRTRLLHLLSRLRDGRLLPAERDLLADAVTALADADARRFGTHDLDICAADLRRANERAEAAEAAITRVRAQRDWWKCAAHQAVAGQRTDLPDDDSSTPPRPGQRLTADMIRSAQPATEAEPAGPDWTRYLRRPCGEVGPHPAHRYTRFPYVIDAEAYGCPGTVGPEPRPLVISIELDDTALTAAIRRAFRTPGSPS